MFGKNKRREQGEISYGAMADIAFLLLIFFLVTTTLETDKGLTMLLPPKKDERHEMELADRNVLKVLVNYKDELLVEDKPMEVNELQEEVVTFISNNGKNPEMSESPQDAVVSIKTDRGTTYKTYIQILDEVKAAYHELRADYLGISVREYLNLEPRKNDRDKKMIKKAKKKYPMRISEAEPTQIKK